MYLSLAENCTFYNFLFVIIIIINIFMGKIKPNINLYYVIVALNNHIHNSGVTFTLLQWVRVVGSYMYLINRHWWKIAGLAAGCPEVLG